MKSLEDLKKIKERALEMKKNERRRGAGNYYNWYGNRWYCSRRTRNHESDHEFYFANAN